MIEITIYYPIGRKVDEPSGDKVRVEFVLPKRPFLFWSDVSIGEQVVYPKGFGIAWYDFERARLLFAPIPFNLLVGALIWSWHWVRFGQAAWFERHTKHK